MKRPGPDWTQSEGHIDWADATAILVIVTFTKMFLAFPERLVRVGQTAGWIVAVTSAAMSLSWLLALVALLRSYRGYNLIEITKMIVGRQAGAFVGLGYSVCVVSLLSIESRQMASALIAVTLPTTPLAFLLIVGYLVVIIVSSLGLEALGRTALITGVYGYSMVVLLPVASLSVTHFVGWTFDSLYPLMGPGLGALLKAGFLGQSHYFELLHLGFLAPYLRRGSDGKRAALLALMLVGMAFTVIILVALLVFPYPSLARVPLPYLRVTRIVGLGRFFQRLDAFFVADWLSAGLVGGAASAYVAGLALASAFGLHKYNRLFNVIAAVIAAVGAYLIPAFNVAIVAEYDIVRPYMALVLEAWPVVLYILHLLKGRRSWNEGRAL